MKPTTPPTWQLFDLRAAGNGRGQLEQWRRNSMTYDQIAGLIRDDYGISVSREWVRLTCNRLGVGSKGVAA